MKKNISCWFLLGLMIWVVMVIVRRKGIFIPYINGYLTDLVTVPMYTYLIQYTMNQVLCYYWKPDLKFILTSIVCISLLFEVVCPLISTRFTGDIFDVLAYFAGGTGYYFFHRYIKRNRQYP